MKICFCVSSFPVLSQTFVTSQVLHALRQGHEVIVACKTIGTDVALSEEQESLLGNVKTIIWPREQPRIFRVLPSSWSSRIAAQLDRAAWRRQIDADVVVAHFGFRGRAVARAQRGWKHRPPLVTVFHGRDVSVEYQRDALAGYRDLLAEGDLHVTVNKQFARQLVECGAPSDHVETRHLGIPISEYEFCSPSFGTTLRFISVCRLVEKKGLETAIRALTLLRQRHPELDWRYEIGGDGPLMDRLRDQVENAKLGDRIEFLGSLPHKDALYQIAGADVLFVPSLTATDGDQEGIPVTLMEAMALGTPVCTTYHSGIPELVTHGETGLLADERNAEGFYKNIVLLAQNPDLAKALAKAAREKVESEFNEDQQNIQFLDRCQALLKQAPAIGPRSTRTPIKLS